jgi:hypothetical protein
MHLFGIAYTSRASRPLLTADIDRMLLAARTNNDAVGVTGVLLYGAGRFFQYFEGERAGIDDVYGRIRASSLHTDLIELQQREIPTRLFVSWHMGFREATESAIQQLSQARWTSELPWVRDHAAASEGIQEMLHFLDEAAD